MSHRPQDWAIRVGELPAAGHLAAEASAPFETIEPTRDGFVDRGGIKLWYAVWGDCGPWLAFAPIFQIAHTQILKGTVPYLSRHFRVLTMDGRGNGRSDRPEGQESYSLEHFYRDFLAVLDAAGAQRLAVVGISAATLLAVRLAAEQAERVTHVVAAGGYLQSRLDSAEAIAGARAASQRMRDDFPGHLKDFFDICFTEPHSTKAFEDGVRYGWATHGRIVDWARNGWLGNDLEAQARSIRCPTLVIHGDADQRVPFPAGEAIHHAVNGARLLTIAGGGHLTAVRDPVIFNEAVRDFILGAPARRTWTRGMGRKRRALFISSPIGLGHVQRDLAIARELRKLQPDLAIDWFTADPAAAYLEREGEHVHPITQRLANESRHFEECAGEHDLHAFFALRSMDEIMVNNFMTFADLMREQHYDLVVGDEAWDVDYYYHENPELKRQPFVFLTDFVGCVPMGGGERETFLCAERNAEDIEHVARFPYVRDAALYVGNREDVIEETFGPGLPGIRAWTDANFEYAGYALPFDPAAFADTEALRARLGYGAREPLVIAAVGGTGVGQPLLAKIAQALPRMRREAPGLRMVMVAGPRLRPGCLPAVEGLEIRPYVHNLFEHLACCDLALVQGGLSTCMELVATRRNFLSFPLRRHFEQCVHVRCRLANYDADRSVDYMGLTPESLADRALAALHEPARYKPVETDGAARAARRIAEVLQNRSWIRR